MDIFWQPSSHSSTLHSASGNHESDLSYIMSLIFLDSAYNRYQTALPLLMKYAAQDMPVISSGQYKI